MLNQGFRVEQLHLPAAVWDENGLIAAITPRLDELIALEFRMDEALYRTAQRLAGEAEDL